MGRVMSNVAVQERSLFSIKTVVRRLAFWGISYIENASKLLLFVRCLIGYLVLV